MFTTGGQFTMRTAVILVPCRLPYCLSVSAVNKANQIRPPVDMLFPAFQTLYTTLFGFHCAFLFLRTGSLIPPIASHMFCNIMGLPGFASDLDVHPAKRTCRLSILLFYFRADSRSHAAIILAYFLGVVGYAYTLGPWTRGFDSVYWH